MFFICQRRSGFSDTSRNVQFWSTDDLLPDTCDVLVFLPHQYRKDASSIQIGHCLKGDWLSDDED